MLQQYLPFTVLKHFFVRNFTNKIKRLQQYLPFTVCAEGCEAAEEQSDDEVRTSPVPERSEGKTRLIWKWSLPFTVLKHIIENHEAIFIEMLQQYLSFTVLKRYDFDIWYTTIFELQQHLPFTVLKPRMC